MQALTENDVALVGRRHAWCENLSLGYLRGALEAAGISVRSYQLNDLGDIRGAAERILESGASVLGLSIPEANSALLALGLGQFLSARGFEGHITCGGPFATLTRRWLLDRYPWLDSVVRFAGEAPLVALARAVGRGDPVSAVPGLTTRDGDGLPAPLFGTQTPPVWPHRDSLTDRLGHKVALMLATRGCPGRCAYCGPAAIQRMERAEARQLGAGDADMAACGIGGVKRRDLSDLCDEMQHLFREKGVRHFAFTDEHMLPFDEGEALDYLDRLDRGLAARGLSHFGMGCQLHATRVTPTMAEKMAGMGFVRVHLGLDIGDEVSGNRFSRPPFGAREAGVVRTMNGLGVATVSNVMVLHPYSTSDTIAASIEGMARVPGGMVEPIRMYVYEGTLLKDQLAAEGRLFGNPFRWEYRALDPVVARFTALFSALKTQVFGDFSLGLRAHELMYNVSLARRLKPELELVLPAERLAEVSKTILSTYIEAYRQALELAKQDHSASDARLLVKAFATRGWFISKTLGDIEASLTSTLHAAADRSSTYRVFAASLFSLCLASSSLVGCHRVNETGSGEDTASDSAPLAMTDSDPADLENGEPAGEDLNDAVDSEALVEDDTDADVIDSTDPIDSTEENIGIDDDFETALQTDSNADSASAAEDDVDSEGEDGVDTASDTGMESDPSADTDTTIASDTDTTIASDTDTTIASGTDTTIAADSGDATDTENDAGLLPCGEVERAAEAARMADAVSKNDPCFKGQLAIMEDGRVSATVYDTGYAGGNVSISGPGEEQMAARAEAVLAELDLRCHEGGTLYADVDGLRDADVQQLYDTVIEQCENFDIHRHSIVIDENGHFEDISVVDGNDEDLEVLACMRDVLKDLTFPCLADSALSYYVLMII
jgi:hypothetical protein